MYKYMEEFELEKATATTAEKELSYAINWVCKVFDVKTIPAAEAKSKFKRYLFY